MCVRVLLTNVPMSQVSIQPANAQASSSSSNPIMGPHSAGLFSLIVCNCVLRMNDQRPHCEWVLLTRPPLHSIRTHPFTFSPTIASHCIAWHCSARPPTPSHSTSMCMCLFVCIVLANIMAATAAAYSWNGNSKRTLKENYSRKKNIKSNNT